MESGISVPKNQYPGYPRFQIPYLQLEKLLSSYHPCVAVRESILGHVPRVECCVQRLIQASNLQPG